LDKKFIWITGDEDRCVISAHSHIHIKWGFFPLATKPISCGEIQSFGRSAQCGVRPIGTNALSRVWCACGPISRRWEVGDQLIVERRGGAIKSEFSFSNSASCGRTPNHPFLAVRGAVPLLWMRPFPVRVHENGTIAGPFWDYERTVAYSNCVLMSIFSLVFQIFTYYLYFGLPLKLKVKSITVSGRPP
jgi:hypothetical protein